MRKKSETVLYDGVPYRQDDLFAQEEVRTDKKQEVPTLPSLPELPQPTPPHYMTYEAAVIHLYIIGRLFPKEEYIFDEIKVAMQKDLRIKEEYERQPLPSQKEQAKMDERIDFARRVVDACTSDVDADALPELRRRAEAQNGRLKTVFDKTRNMVNRMIKAIQENNKT